MSAQNSRARAGLIEFTASVLSILASGDKKVPGLFGRDSGEGEGVRPISQARSVPTIPL
jgi:hypothetical protein